MTDWKENIIVAVHYKDKESKNHILSVKVLKDLGKTLGNQEIMARQKVIDFIKSGKRFITAYKKDNGKWSPGDDVGIVHVYGQDFIRTDGNSIPKDNLGKLPEF